MKIVCVIAILSISCFCYGQSDSSSSKLSLSSEKIYTFVELPAKFPGGDGAMIGFVRKNIQYPQDEKKNGIQGMVLIEFVIDTDGSITNPRITRSVNPAIDKEAIRVVSILPKFIPAHQQGKVVKQYFNIPVQFKLSDKN